MGWIWLAVFGGGAMVLLALLGVGRRLWSFVGAALMLGGAGYAWQGSPMLAGKSVDAKAMAREDDPAMIALRDNMLGRFTLDGAYLIASDAMAAGGDDKAAVRALLGGINKLPTSYALWTGLGMAYARHDGGQVSPAASFAFEQARRLAPNHPAPLFLEGLAYVRAGDLTTARGLWRQALQRSPPRISYRREIAVRLALVERLMAMQREGR